MKLIVKTYLTDKHEYWRVMSMTFDSVKGKNIVTVASNRDSAKLIAGTIEKRRMIEQVSVTPFDSTDDALTFAQTDNFFKNDVIQEVV